MPGRIQSYIHSDSTTQNKGGSLVEVTCQTDFAAKTKEFVDFVGKVAKMAYAASAVTSQPSEIANVKWKDIIDNFPDLETARLELSKEIKEEISMKNAIVLAIRPHWAIEEN